MSQQNENTTTPLRRSPWKHVTTSNSAGPNILKDNAGSFRQLSWNASKLGDGGVNFKKMSSKSKYKYFLFVYIYIYIYIYLYVYICIYLSIYLYIYIYIIYICICIYILLMSFKMFLVKIVKCNMYKVW